VSAVARFVLEVERLKKHFPVQRGLFKRTVAQVKAVDGVSFSIAPGETLCLVGESGCGKSTVGKLVLRLIEPTEGEIRLDGETVTGLSGGAMRPYRRRIQMVFQDPYASLNPRLKAGQIVGEPLENYEAGPAADREAKVAALFSKVGLRPDAMKRYPFEFSGGQRQRLGIARALALNPAVIVADEPVSALDVSVQAQILNLLVSLQRDLGLSYLFISHDLGVVKHISDRVAVMYLGRIVEIASRDLIFASPGHPYTELLLRSAPPAHPRDRQRYATAADDVPSATSVPSGCPFHPRCPLATDVCRAEMPPLTTRPDGRLLACHHR
jgi:peptide/nickel transport system ATP-binding protein